MSIQALIHLNHKTYPTRASADTIKAKMARNEMDALKGHTHHKSAVIVSYQKAFKMDKQ